MICFGAMQTTYSYKDKFCDRLRQAMIKGGYASTGSKTGVSPLALCNTVGCSTLDSAVFGGQILSRATEIAPVFAQQKQSMLYQ